MLVNNEVSQACCMTVLFTLGIVKVRSRRFLSAKRAGRTCESQHLTTHLAEHVLAMESGFSKLETAAFI